MRPNRANPKDRATTRSSALPPLTTTTERTLLLALLPQIGGVLIVLARAR
jgi:hypothetical protein